MKVPVQTSTVMSGYLLLKTRGKTWQKRWFALRSDFVLYSYRSHEGEERAVTATPVPGNTVCLMCSSSNSSMPAASTSSVIDSSHSSPSHHNVHKAWSDPCSDTSSTTAAHCTFQMAHVRKSYLFQAASRQDAERYVYCITQCEGIKSIQSTEYASYLNPNEWRCCRRRRR